MAKPLLLEQQHFLNCIREHEQPIVSAEDGLRAMEYAARISEMARPASRPDSQPAAAEAAHDTPAQG